MNSGFLYKFLTIFFLILAIIGGSTGYYFYTEAVFREEQANVTTNRIIQSADGQIISQKKQKNEISDIFDEQAALNDDLIDSQRDLITASQEYIRFIDASIRFVNGEPQLFPNLKEEDFLKKKNGLAQKVAELQKIAEENASVKERNADRIRQIYLEAGEDRNNTANEREGFR